MEEIFELAAFFCQQRTTLSLKPIGTRLALIWRLYRGDEKDPTAFLGLINRLDQITNTCFEAAKPLNIDSEIESIAFDKIEMVHAMIGGYDRGSIAAKPVAPRNSLFMELLGRPSILPRYLELGELLAKPTAQTQLAAAKMRLKTPRKPFTEVCKLHGHMKALASIIGGPTLPPAHALLGNSKLKAHSELFQCALKKVHYIPVVTNYTDIQLGDCSYLNTCHRMKTCRYLHYHTLHPLRPKKVSLDQDQMIMCRAHEYTIGECLLEYERPVCPPQWIKCDIRSLPFEILGKFAAIIADPAWDIHMSLPYGTCKDAELMSLPMHELQDEGIMLLWVTGRSIESGRKALRNWGYQLSDELIWVKLNQLRRTIVTGRTGHWLNHSKEHMLVGVKGNPTWLNRLVDSNVVVSSTRETLRKPDEVYDIVERIVGKHARKLELFGRDNNVRPGWITVGDQVDGVQIHEEDVKRRHAHHSATNNK